jgi:hypothetical protein
MSRAAHFCPARTVVFHWPAKHIGRVWRVAEALEYGIVGINEGLISK